MPSDVSSPLRLESRKAADGTYLAYIDGAWLKAASGPVYPNVDPASKTTVLGHVPEASAAEVRRAAAAAERDFWSWRLWSGDFRTKAFLRLAALLRESEQVLVQTMTREMGKSLFDSRLDWEEAVGVCEALAPQGANLKGVTYQKLADGVAMESRVAPRGVAAVITPFNFPVAIPLAQIVAALVTGNTVVWKPSHLVPECSQLLALLVLHSLEAEAARASRTLPRGIFHLIFGDAAAGDALVRDPAVQVVSFTGSKKVGDRVDAIASGLGKRVMKEVSGINLFYVHCDADLDRAARNFIYGKTITSGQRCSSIQEALVDREVEAAFIAKVLALAPGVVHSPGGSEEVARASSEKDRWACPPLVSAEQLARLERLVRESLAKGARVLYQAKLPLALREQGFYFPFTLLTDVGHQNPLHSEEAFGPVGVITAVKGIGEAIDVINSKVGIVACIDSRDKSATENFIERVLRTRIDDGRHGTGAFWGTKFGGDRGAGSGNPALDEDMVYGYLMWKTIYRAYEPFK
jgi:acyl-CoA reductase-like NAD-dependent aldehyde dehydrogenase